MNIAPLPKGTALSRYLRAVSLSQGSYASAAEIARQWPDSPQVMLTLEKAAIAAMSGDPQPFDDLVQYASTLELRGQHDVLGCPSWQGVVTFLGRDKQCAARHSGGSLGRRFRE